VEHYADRRRAGEPRCFPLALHKATFGCTVPSIVEAFIVDSATERYCLVPRPEKDPVFGGGRLHILGGASNPGSKGMLEDAKWMAREEFGFEDLSYVAGPIAVYTWQPSDMHPFGTPRSELYVLRAIGKLPEQSPVNWFKIGERPTVEQMMFYPFGNIHDQFITIFNEALRRKFDCACVDLNMVK
jgi:hypothetical protein